MIPFRIRVLCAVASFAPAQTARLLVDTDPAGSGMYGHRYSNEAWFGSATRPAGLWKTDGSAAGTVRLLGTAGAFSGAEVWFSDLTPNGMRLVAKTSSHTSYFVTGDGEIRNDRLYFALETPGAGLEPWGSDGTAAGTRMLADLRPGPDSSDP